MDYTQAFRSLVRMKWLATTLTVAMLSWALGIPLLFNTASAQQLTFISATASSSAPLVSSNYVVQFTNVNAIGQAVTASTTRITFDPYGNSFDFSTLVVGDVSISGAQVTGVASIAGCAAGQEMYPSLISSNPDYIELTTCAGDIIAPGALNVNIVNAHITNPSATGSYVVRIGGTMADGGDTRVAIINYVTMTATVDTNFSFSIAGVASSSLVNGDTTSTTTVADPTKIGFGVISVGTSSIAAQDISVSTNALHGFSVTVTQDGDLRSSNGANINAFVDGNPAPGGVLAAPAAWASPVPVLGNTNSYGHMGITSDDSDLPIPFTSGQYGGMTSTSTRTVLAHTAVALDTVQDVGMARVGFRVEVSALQEAATDYTNIITYVATPIF